MNRPLLNDTAVSQRNLVHLVARLMSVILPDTVGPVPARVDTDGLCAITGGEVITSATGTTSSVYVALATVVNTDLKVLPDNDVGRGASRRHRLLLAPGVHHVESLIVVGACALVTGAGHDGHFIGSRDSVISCVQSVLFLDLVDPSPVVADVDGTFREGRRGPNIGFIGNVSHRRNGSGRSRGGGSEGRGLNGGSHGQKNSTLDGDHDKGLTSGGVGNDEV